MYIYIFVYFGKLQMPFKPEDIRPPTPQNTPIYNTEQCNFSTDIILGFV